MLQRWFFRQAMSFLFLFLFPWPALAIPTVSISFVGNYAFLLSGTNLEDVGKIEVAVCYDASLLANPILTPKSFFEGAVVAQGNSSDGNVRLTVTSGKPMKGNGPFATLAFNQIGTSTGVVNSLNGRVYGSNGAALPVFFAVTNPTPPLDPGDPDDVPMIQERERNGETFMGGGVSFIPPPATGVVKDSGGQSDHPEVVRDATAGEGTAEQAAGFQEGPTPKKDPESPALPTLSVLERFRLFKGERNARNLMALFDTAPAASFRQDPPIVLADGNRSVRVIVSKVAAGKTPRFTFSSARYASHGKISETEWFVEATPDKGALSAGMVLLDGGTPRQIPLTVTPAARVDLITPGKVSEADFARFLQEHGTPDALSYDLNGDGELDYKDDYIFTANYLIEMEKRHVAFRLAPGLHVD